MVGSENPPYGLSVEKYCSALAMLARTAKLTHDFEVADTGA
jgi:putative redox protein